MSRKLEEQMEEIYQEWLMETFPEDIRCKDDLIELALNGTHRERFKKTIMEVIQ